MKHVKQANFADFYEVCLKELMSRPNWNDSFVPMLERYVTMTSKLQELNAAIVDAEVVTDHTNNQGATNKATSPLWRMFLMLNGEANKLAKQLELSPDNCPVPAGKVAKKGFELGEMKKSA